MNPAAKPILAPRPVTLCISKPITKTASRGPLIKDPNLLTATNTVLAISSTQKASTIANTPQTAVSALLHSISTRS